MLWALNGGTNNDWLLEEMLCSGLPEIRSAFEQLLYGRAPIAERLDAVKEKACLMEAAGVAEIFAHHDHKRYPIRNRRSRQGMVNLGLSEAHLPRLAQISGSQYAELRELARAAQIPIVVHCPEFDDPLGLDFLLYPFSLQGQRPRQPIPSSTTVEHFDHDTMIDQLFELRRSGIRGVKRVQSHARVSG